MSKLTQLELSAIIEAASTGTIGYIFSPAFQKLLTRAREQMKEERGRAIYEMVEAQRAEKRDRYKVRCPQCGSRLVLEGDYD